MNLEKFAAGLLFRYLDVMNAAFKLDGTSGLRTKRYAEAKARFRGYTEAADHLDVAATPFAAEMAAEDAWRAESAATGPRPEWRAVDNTAMREWDARAAARIIRALQGDQP